MQKAKTLVRFFLGVPLTILAFAFIGKLIYNAGPALILNLKHFDPFGIVVGIIFFLLFFFLRSLLWKAVLNVEGYHPSVMESTYLLATSELRRYIPGSVLAIVGRVNSFNVYNIPAKTILKMVFYESVLFFLASIVISIPGVLFLFVHRQVDTRIIFGVAILLIVIFTIVTFFAKKRAIKLIIDSPKYIKAFLIMCTAWIFFGIGNYLILNSFYHLDPSNIVAITSFFILSWLVGYVIVITPMGLGIREGFLTYELAFFVPVGAAAALSVIARIAFVICEIVFVTFAYFVHKHFRPRPKIEASDAVLWGMIGAYLLYFLYINFTATDPFFMSLYLAQTLILGIGALLVFEISQKVIKDQTLSLVFVASYLLNPFIQKANGQAFGINFLITEAAVVGFYVAVILIVEKILSLELRFLKAATICFIIIAISIISAYYWGNLPGSLNYLTH